MADSWIKGFGPNQVCFDAQAKELVLISNGKCTKPHSQDTYDGHMSDGRGCAFEPHEAIALRPLAIRGKRPRFHVGWTYRGVDAAKLTHASEVTAAEFKQMLACAKIGRV